MAAVVASRSNGSGGGSFDHELSSAAMDAGKYARYTTEQVEALERVYAECPKPSSARRQQLLRECPILANVEPKQIKVWFQNRRCRDKQKKESSQLQSVNRKLTSMNKLLIEENNRLQMQASQLVRENGYLRQQLQNLQASATNDTSCESASTTPHIPARDANNPSGLMCIAEETLVEFLSKAKGTAIDWVQMPGMKPGPDSDGIVVISHGCRGIAARVCGLVNLEPTMVVSILKDRPSWFNDCRKLEIFSSFPAGSSGTIELVYMQMYAPTTLVPARDFWTIRYTRTLDNGSIVVCERSLSGSGGNGCCAENAVQFVRAEMLPSGFLVRSCDGGGSIVHIVDHLDLEPLSVPEVLRPLYESSSVVAQKMTTAAMRYIRQIAQETSGEKFYPLGRQPAALRTFSQRLCKGFNDAICGFTDDGWNVLGSDGIEDVVVAVNATRKIRNTADAAGSFASPGGIICAKASLLLQSVPPAALVRFLRGHRSEWADYNMDAFCAASLRTGSCALPVLHPAKYSGNQVIIPLAQTVENEEILEVVRLEGQVISQDASILSSNIHLLQLCSGIDESAVGNCFQLVFAPMDELFPEVSACVSSGFRIIPLDIQDLTSHTLDLASSLDMGSATHQRGMVPSEECSSPLRSVLSIAFQFPYELHLQDTIAMMARQYIRSVISAVQRVSMVISPSQTGVSVGHKVLGFPEASTLAHWVCQSYRLHLGLDLLNCTDQSSETLLKTLWHHRNAILCCSLMEKPSFIFANQAGLDMLETSLVSLQDILLDQIFDKSGQKLLYTEISKLMQQGYVNLPSGTCLSSMGRPASYEEAFAWKVLGEDNCMHCLAFCFVNWCFE